MTRSSVTGGAVRIGGRKDRPCISETENAGGGQALVLGPLVESPKGMCLRRAALAPDRVGAAGSELAADRIRVLCTRGRLAAGVCREEVRTTKDGGTTVIKKTATSRKRCGWPGLEAPGTS